MRRARYFPMMVVGLAGIAGQAAMLTKCCAWDSVPAAFVEDQAYAQPANAPQRDGRYIDPSVQQAGYYDARPRPASPAAGAQATSPSRGGALFRGQKLRMPTLPFGRQTNSHKSMARVPQANGPTSAPNSSGQLQPRLSAQSAAARQGMTQSMPAGRPPQSVAQGPMQRQRSPGSYPTARTAPPGAAARTVPNSSSVSPWQSPPPAVRTAAPNPAPAAAAQVQPAQPAQQVQPAGPPSPADRLVAEAHALSTRAEYEEDYTQIIETCRRAQASQASATTNQFATSLIAWSLNRRGQLRAEAAQEKEAILDFDDAIRNDATCWRALHNRGVLLAQAGQFEKAFDDFSRTIQINPQYAKAYSNRAALYMVADKLEAALADYHRAIELDADLAVAHRGCGRVCQLLGQVDEAIAHYDASVQLAPNDGYAAACRADLLTDVGRYAEAEMEYERAIEIDPSLSQAHGGSAWLLATCPDSAVRNPELAIERARTAIEQDGGQDALNFDTLAAAQASAGDFEGAMDSARKAIELAPAEEREIYEDRLALYQQAQPYRIAPVERTAQQVNYEEQTK